MRKKPRRFHFKLLNKNSEPSKDLLGLKSRSKKTKKV
jgi:hypothetical protein